MGIATNRTWLIIVIVTIATTLALLVPSATAQDSSGEFSLQITPSPLVFSAKPGTSTTVQLKIRNSGPQTEELKIEPKAFKIDQVTDDITLLETSPPEVDSWISFTAPIFTVSSGEWYTQDVTFSPPATAGFSYSFALQISRTQDPAVEEGERALKGTIAVFTLINIDRPGATKELEIASFGANKNIYEYLPVSLSTSLRNTGNTILQPYGNIFIQRGHNDEVPIATLPFNDQNRYILPDTTRTFTNIWDDGFPVYTTTTTNGNDSTRLTWDWDNVNNLRYGRYTAKLVAIYNNGSRDIPLEASTQFWVIPWKFLLVCIAIFAIFAFGIWAILSRVIHNLRRKSTKHKSNKKAKNSDPEETIINLKTDK